MIHLSHLVGLGVLHSEAGKLSYVSELACERQDPTFSDASAITGSSASHYKNYYLVLLSTIQ